MDTHKFFDVLEDVFKKPLSHQDKVKLQRALGNYVEIQLNAFKQQLQTEATLKKIMDRRKPSL